MKKYFKSFLTEDDGIETIEFVALLAVAAVLIVIVSQIGASLKTKGESVKGQIDNAINGLPGE